MSAPLINSKTPAEDAVSVYLNDYIEIVFDQAIDQATLNDNTVLLYRVSDYHVVEKTLSFNVGNNTLTIAPNIVFDQNTQYNAVVVGADQSSSCVKNVGAEPLAVSSTWNFTTGTLPKDPQGEFGEEDEEAIDKSTAESPVSLVLPPKSTEDLIIVSTNPENYSPNIGTMNGDFETEMYNGPITVTFNQPIASGSAVSQDWVTFDVQPVDGDPSTSTALPSGYLSNTLGSTLTWTPSTFAGNNYNWRVNNEITVTVSASVKSATGTLLGNQFRFMFTTLYRPFYCTVPKIRSVIGSFIREIPDDTIARNIYLNSLEAYNIANTIYSQYLWSIDQPTFAAKMWTCCKTQYDLLYAKLLDMASSGPGMIKRLGDFTIQESTEIQAGVKGALQKSLDCSNAWLKLILGKYRRAKSKMAVKGVTSPATPPMRGVRTWTLETGRDTLGDNKTLTRRIKSPGIYSDWS
jgi:hypothetical protein